MHFEFLASEQFSNRVIRSLDIVAIPLPFKRPLTTATLCIEAFGLQTTDDCNAVRTTIRHSAADADASLSHSQLPCGGEMVTRGALTGTRSVSVVTSSVR